jgi:NADH-quinone oxidoreductase subunit L
MEGPTPVSALIHAATMVTAGLYLLIRVSSLLEYAPICHLLLITIGSVTAILAASSATAQYDLKKVIALSTVSQLGFMFIGIGMQAYGASL